MWCIFWQPTGSFTPFRRTEENEAGFWDGFANLTQFLLVWEAIIIAPLQGWFRGFRSDFRWTRRWLIDLPLSLVALIREVVTKLPRRLGRLGAHIFLGLRGSLAWIIGLPRRRPGPFTGSADVQIQSNTQPKKQGQDNLAVQPPGASSIWLPVLAWMGRFLAKTVDLISLGEIVDLLTILIKVNTRSLTEVEIEEARRVFGDSLTYWRIRLDEWSPIAHVGKWAAERRFGQPVHHLAVTVFSTIHFSRRIHPEPGNSDMAWLIHELAHTAQMEFIGTQFMGEALHAQGAEGYDYGGPEALKNKQLVDFNREQQGDIARDYYRSLYGQVALTSEQRQDYERLIGQLRQGKI